MIPGFVRVSVKGQQCQRFVNLCRGREMDLKRIIRTGETELQLTMKVAPADELSERAGGLFRSIQKEDQLQCTCRFPAKRISGDHLGVCRIFGNGPAF